MIRSLHESLSKVQGHESVIFQTYVTFSISFPNIYNDYLYSNVIDSFFYFGKRRRFLPPGAYAFFTSSVHVPLDTVFNKI